MRKLKRLTRRLQHKTIYVLASAAVLFVLVNVGLFVYYHSRTYPNTRIVQTSVGNLTYAQLQAKLRSINLLPNSLKLTYNGQSQDVPIAKLGMSPDYSHIDSGAHQRFWLPIVNLLIHHDLATPVAIDSATFNKKATELGATFHQDPSNAHITLSNGRFGIAPEKAGYDLVVGSLRNKIITELQLGHVTITVPVKKITAATTAASLASTLKTLQNQLNSSLTYRYNGAAKKLSTKDISGWYAPSGNSYALSDSLIHDYLYSLGRSLGIYISGLSQITANSKNAVLTGKSLDVTLVPFTNVKTFSYCVAARGVDSSFLAAFMAKLSAVYHDPRGWTLDGQVHLNYATSGCSFTAWLSANNQMSSFGGLCGPQWSCRVGNNVVVNFDRWQSASDAWNSYGGSLDDYRSMVINHETGHWFGFDHKHCSGAGQLAPVMQQQSINLEGCKFNPWPLPSELANLRNMLAL